MRALTACRFATLATNDSRSASRWGKPPPQPIARSAMPQTTPQRLTEAVWWGMVSGARGCHDEKRIAITTKRRGAAGGDGAHAVQAAI